MKLFHDILIRINIRLNVFHIGLTKRRTFPFYWVSCILIFRIRFHDIWNCQIKRSKFCPSLNKEIDQTFRYWQRNKNEKPHVFIWVVEQSSFSGGFRLIVQIWGPPNQLIIRRSVTEFEREIQELLWLLPYISIHWLCLYMHTHTPLP